MEMSSVAMRAPRAPPITAIQSVIVAFGSLTRRDLRCAGVFRAIAARVYAHGDGKARQQQRPRLLAGVDVNAHRNALNDFREVTRGVLRREQGELRAGAGREARDG